MNIFEKATKKKLRFSSPVGKLSVEDIWDLTLEELDEAAIALNKKLKEHGEESFIKKTNPKLTDDQLRFDIIKHVIELRLAEEEKAKTAALKKQKRTQLLELMAKKENEELAGKSVDELRAELEALEAE